MKKIYLVFKVSLMYCFISGLCFANQDVSPQKASEVMMHVGSVTSGQKHQSQLTGTDEQEPLTQLQQQKINELEIKVNKLDNSGGMNFAVWTGILLAAVAIILTALGVVMAIFSFLGYKKIMNSVHDIATSISENVAKEVAKEIAEDLTPGVTEGVLIKLFEEKRFDKVINQAVEKIIYRGIQLDNDNVLDGGVE
ncbi:hypothetical protein [Enterobacter asburiae]|uniref:hypothetical protein n=1 Tax=Enterobacter asburiae TaxID=61645 RepID=UPI0038968B2C